MVIIGGKGLRPMVKVKEKEKDTAHRKKGVFLFPVLFLFVPITLRTAQSSFYNPSNLEKQALLPPECCRGVGGLYLLSATSPYPNHLHLP